MWIEQMVRRGAQMWPHRTALFDDHRAVSFSQFAAEVYVIAEDLRAGGVGPGDVVAVCVAANRVEIVAAYCAINLLGAAYLPLSNEVPKDDFGEVVHKLNVSHITGHLSDSDDRVPEHLISVGLRWEEGELRSPPLPEAWNLSRPDDRSSLYLTSATTGDSKVVELDQQAFCAASTAFMAESEIRSDDVVLNCNSLVYASTVIPMTYLFSGAAVGLMDAFIPQRCVKVIEEQKVTHLWLVPQMLRYIVRTKAAGTSDLRSMREVVYAASRMEPELREQAGEVLGCRFRQVYGLTEALLVAHMRPEEFEAHRDDDTGVVGRPVVGVQLAIVGEDGKFLGPDEVGAVCVRAPSEMRGYVDNTAAEQEVRWGDWLVTGDAGYVDGHGLVHLTGRNKELINRGGEKVHPAKVESVVETHPGVSQAAVFGVPDEDWGEVPVCYAVPADGESPEPEELAQYCREKLASYMRPVHFELVRSFPRNGLGKVLRSRLRDEWTARAAARQGR